MKRLILSTSLALALTATAASASTKGANVDWEGVAKDAWIDGKVETVLLVNTNLNSFDITTDVNEGTVVLGGTVSSDIERDLAEELTLTVEGVKDVDNNIDVAGDMSADDLAGELTDNKIAAVIKTKLLWEADVRGMDINVAVSDGTVTLSGEVKSDTARDLAMAIANNTHDVNGVVDNLTVIFADS
jgi:osmotically-inducible protein OsmY